MKNKEITIWERLQEKSKSWKHNHISDGYDADILSPIPISVLQKKSWNKSQWLSKKGMINGQRVVTEHISDK